MGRHEEGVREMPSGLLKIEVNLPDHNGIIPVYGYDDRLGLRMESCVLGSREGWVEAEVEVGVRTYA